MSFRSASNNLYFPSCISTKSPFSKKIILFVCSRIAAESEAKNTSPSPTPKTRGLIILPATIVFSCLVVVTTNAYVPSKSFVTLTTVSNKLPFHCLLNSIATTSVSVSDLNE